MKTLDIVGMWQVMYFQRWLSGIVTYTNRYTTFVLKGRKVSALHRKYTVLLILILIVFFLLNFII